MKRLAMLTALCLSALAGCPAHAEFDHKPIVNDLRADLRTGDPETLARRIDDATDTMFKLAVSEMLDAGMVDEADDLNALWTVRGCRGAGGAELTGRDIGDHAPLSDCLEQLYDRTEAALGTELMAFLHLDDIWKLNYGVPVALHIKTIDGADIDQSEYALHFVPTASVISYWSVWAGCTGATWGLAYSVICTPAAMLSRHLTTEFIAPPLAPRFYQRLY